MSSNKGISSRPSSPQGKGGAGRGQGRKSDFNGVQKANGSISVPREIKEPGKRLLVALWNSGKITNRSSTEDLIEFIEGQGLIIFPDIEVPATFGLTTSGTAEEYETFSLISHFEQRRRSSSNQLFALRVTGDSMTSAGIFPGDLLIIEDFQSNSNEPPAENDIVIARLPFDETTVKRYSTYDSEQIMLSPETTNPTQRKPRIVSKAECEIVGVVRFVIHDPRNRF